MPKHSHQEENAPRSAPLWKKIVAVLVIIAMPVFFASYRLYQTKQAANFTEPLPDTQRV